MMETQSNRGRSQREVQGRQPTRRRAAPLILGSVAALVGLVATACGTGQGGASATSPASGTAAPLATGAGTRTNEGGQVTVKVTWKGVAAGPVFDVALDTHAVDLDGYDLRQLATLRTDGGEAQPAEWTAPKGGHHREGNLVFPATVGGRPTIGDGTRRIELIVRNVAGVAERRFEWTLS